MTALDLILRLVKPGETVLAGDDIYGGSNRLLGWAGTDGGLVRLLVLRSRVHWLTLGAPRLLRTSGTSTRPT
jgi:hypothetical protein